MDSLKRRVTILEKETEIRELMAINAELKKTFDAEWKRASAELLALMMLVGERG